MYGNYIVVTGIVVIALCAYIATTGLVVYLVFAAMQSGRGTVEFSITGG